MAGRCLAERSWRVGSRGRLARLGVELFSTREGLVCSEWNLISEIILWLFKFGVLFFV